ncbi:MAG: hypothetical protein ACFCUE_14115 [Candidatus Bathyarchaeia archaeon]
MTRQQEENLLSDLANSCEYLNFDKTCTAFNDNQKAQASRQLKCRKEEKNTCCYLCDLRLQCTISCKYLGQTENYPASAYENEKVSTVEKTLEIKPETVPVALCISCNSEMAWAQTQLHVNDWHGPKPALNCDKELPLTVYLCPNCGKIEFRANITKNEDRF